MTAAPSCLSIRRLSLPVATFHRRIVLSAPVEARSASSATKATDVTSLHDPTANEFLAASRFPQADGAIRTGGSQEALSLE